MDFLKEIQKINEMADFVDESSLSQITDWISTGSYSLNGILSGDIFKGIAAGRITGLMGKNSTGKSFFVHKIVRNAQQKGYDIVWFESENATDKFVLSRAGIDTSKLIIVPVFTVEEFRNQAVKILELFKKVKETNPEKKLMFVLDSLGNLPTEKEMADALAGKNAMDMGIRAKIIRSLSRLITMPVAELQIPFVLTNHTYTNSSGYVPIEVSTGGEGPMYICTVVAMLTKQKVKEEIDGAKSQTGNILKALTAKNRVVPEGQVAEVKVDFEEGISPYYGLLDWAEAAGLVEKQSTTYYVKHLDKKFFEKNIYVPEVWEPILTELNEYVKKKVTYSSVSDGMANTPEPPKAVAEEVEAEKPKKKKDKA
jgi:RecA/RadA recombinase